MFQIIKKMLGMKTLEQKISDLRAKIECLEDITIKSLKKRINEQDKVLEVLLDNVILDIDKVLKKYRYIKFKELPNFVKDIFYEKYDVVMQCFSDYVFIHYKGKDIGSTYAHLGELIDRIEEIDKDN